jgi:hypothetical protein
METEKKIKGQIYKGNLGFSKNTKGILRRLVKKSLNLNSFPSIPPNFEGNENLGFGGNRKEWVFHSITFT